MHKLSLLDVPNICEKQPLGIVPSFKFARSNRKKWLRYFLKIREWISVLILILILMLQFCSDNFLICFILGQYTFTMTQ